MGVGLDWRQVALLILILALVTIGFLAGLLVYAVQADDHRQMAVEFIEPVTSGHTCPGDIPAGYTAEIIAVYGDQMLIQCPAYGLVEFQYQTDDGTKVMRLVPADQAQPFNPLAEQ